MFGIFLRPIPALEAIFSGPRMHTNFRTELSNSVFPRAEQIYSAGFDLSVCGNTGV